MTIIIIIVVVVVIAFRILMLMARKAGAESQPVGTVETYTYTGKSGALSEQFSKMGMEQHINLMITNGWEVVNQTGLPGHVRLGRTLTGAALTGGLSLLAGGSRTADRVTITYRRVQVPARIAAVQAGAGTILQAQPEKATSRGIECSTCKFPNPSGARVCINCGKVLTDGNDSIAQGPGGAGVPHATADTDARVCPHCGVRLPPDAIFCRNCGTSLVGAKPAVNAKVCSNCGSQSLLDTAFCSKCGTRLSSVAMT